jgi:hypothetical protein
MAAGVMELNMVQMAWHTGLALALTSLCSLAGAAMYEQCTTGADAHSPCLRIGSGFALGISLFLVLWRLISALSGESQTSLYVTIFCLSIYCVTQRNTLRSLLTLPSLHRSLGTIALLFLLVEVVVAAIWLRLFDGSDHSQLYGTAIAGHIISTGKIPVLGLHYGQSMLSAAVAILAGTNAHNLSLHIFLTISVLMLAITVHGALRTYRLGNGLSLLGAFLFMTGSYALTLVHGVSFSTLSPMLICGYTDDILAVSTFIIFLICLDRYFTSDTPAGTKLGCALICPGVLAASWNLTAPQNIATGFAVLGLLPVGMLWRRSRWFKRSLLLLLVCGACFVGTSQLGGPFSSKARQDATFHSIASASYQFKPEIPFAVARTAIAPLWHIRPPFDGEFPVFKLWQLEENLWSGIRMCFYPLCGLVLLGLLLSREEEYGPHAIPLRRFWCVACITFITGFALAFALHTPPFDKWGLNKFLTSSLTLGNLALVAAFRLLLIKADTLRRRMAIAVVVVLITAPPLLSVGTAVYHSLTAPQHMETLPQRLVSLSR